ncbi:hypothetical protein K2173_025294 [Erythroxylum novogranatense]|uniref:ATG8-interacting protein 1 n=1 Tax=Erythroxylum novogranatense TaxID=1862640 RepID=A0AAV8UH24_9ROSI|nr:hypothetical protein K2173_025294 [Erythroxylum novogranatense]
MAEKDEGEESIPIVNEWEVVQLTASTYAAAPGPKKIVVKDDGKDNTNREDEADFVFPPNQHENLPLEPDSSEIVDESAGKNLSSEVSVQTGGRSCRKEEENWALKGLNVSEEFPGIPLFDEKGNRMSKAGKEFEESANLQHSILSGKEQSVYNASAFDSFHDEAGLSGSTTFGENLGIPEVNEPSEPSQDFPMDSSSIAKSTEDGRYDGSSTPNDAWWKRKAASLYSHAKDADAFWSIFVAAAVMGLVIIGQQWQQERWQVLRLKWQANINSQISSRVMWPVYRLKEVIVGGHRRGSLIGGSSSSDI